jgi:hypothetical protein
MRTYKSETDLFPEEACTACTFYKHLLCISRPSSLRVEPDSQYRWLLLDNIIDFTSLIKIPTHVREIIMGLPMLE